MAKAMKARLVRGPVVCSWPRSSGICRAGRGRRIVVTHDSHHVVPQQTCGLHKCPAVAQLGGHSQSVSCLWAQTDDTS